jgi:arabinofuranosyltransferase
MSSHARPFWTLPRVVAVIAVFVIAAAWLFLAREKRIAGEWGYALDDSWIYAVMARNLATGHGFSFNPGEPVAGSTGPLYTFILALLYLVFHEVVWSAKVFGVFCQISAGAAVYAAALALFPGRRFFSLVVALLVATSPALLWGMLSGMEISLYLFLVCVGLAFYVRSRHLLAVLFWSLGVWVRPDGLFLVALGLIGSPRQALRRAAVALPIVLAYFGFNLLVGGHWMPQTVGAKTHFGLDLANRTWNMIREWACLWGVPYRHTDRPAEPIVLLVLLLVGAVISARRLPLLAAYAIGFPLTLSLFRDGSGSHNRYIFYVIPFAMLLAAVAIEYLTRRWDHRAPALASAAAVGCLLWQAALVPREAESYAWNVQNINKMQRLLGNFVKLTTRPGDVIAVNDIGAIGYFGERYVVDLIGLVSPRRTLPENLARYRPRLLIIFPEWFREYARDDPRTGNFIFYDADSTHRY